jgi:hypothetical protein
MRCVDVIRELAVPTGTADPSAMAEHLAGCPRCASWSERDAKLDRLWEATRPEPPSGAWDAIWARASEALDRPRTIPVPTRRPVVRRAAIVGIGLAQAAAILVAILAWPRPQPGPGPIGVAYVERTADSKPVPGPVDDTYEIAEGQTLIISADGRGARDCDLDDGIKSRSTALVPSFSTVDRNLAFYNAIEALASFETMASLQ